MRREKTGGLPEGWACIPVRSAVEKVSTTGKKVKTKDCADEGAYPVIDQGQQFVAGYSNRSECVVDVDDPIIVFGDHSRTVKLVRANFIPGADGIKVLRPLGGVLAEYLEHALRFRTIDLVDKGYARHYQHLEKLNVPVPPFNEQRRIVAKIEELFSELDNGVESLKTARAQIQTYRQSLLKAAFEGRLTQKWRRDNTSELETASQLLCRIREERKARYQEEVEKWKAAASKWEEDGRRGKKPRKPSPPKFGEAPNEMDEGILPEGWGVAKVSDVADVGTGVTPLKKRSDYYDGGTIPWVTSTAVNQEYIREPSGYVTETALSETNLRLYPKGTLLVAMYGEGKTRGKASELAIEATTNQALAAIRCEGISAQLKAYLKWFLVYNYDRTRDSSSGGVQPNLNLGIVENTEFPLCSLEEQKEIVERLESAFARANELERVIESSLNQSEAGRQSILKRAFEGKLVPQDLNDEPASTLLERIRQEQGDQPMQKRGNRKTGATG